QAQLVDGLVAVGVERSALAEEVQGRAGTEGGACGLEVEGHGLSLTAQAQLADLKAAPSRGEELLEAHRVQARLPYHELREQLVRGTAESRRHAPPAAETSARGLSFLLARELQTPPKTPGQPDPIR